MSCAGTTASGSDSLRTIRKIAIAGGDAGSVYTSPNTLICGASSSLVVSAQYASKSMKRLLPAMISLLLSVVCRLYSRCAATRDLYGPCTVIRVTAAANRGVITRVERVSRAAWGGHAESCKRLATNLRRKLFDALLTGIADARRLVLQVKSCEVDGQAAKCGRLLLTPV